MAKIIVFKGRKYRLSGNYYRHHNWGKGGPSNLHRAIWEDHHGPIPKGLEIHHRDGDGTNNKLSNLELMDAREHQRRHTLERWARGEMKPPNERALRLAAEWHASKEGFKWHSKNGKHTWKDREWHLCTCQECGREFRTPYPKRTKFCHLNCKMTAFRRRHGRVVGTRSRKIISLSNKQAP